MGRCVILVRTGWRMDPRSHQDGSLDDCALHMQLPCPDGVLLRSTTTITTATTTLLTITTVTTTTTTISMTDITTVTPLLPLLLYG